MNKLASVVLALCLALFFAAISHAQSFTLPGHGVLSLDVPTGWQAQVRQPPGNLPPTIKLSDAQALLLITPLWNPNGEKLDLSDTKLRKLMEDEGVGMLPTAIEKTQKISKIQGQFAKGYYSTFTDKAPKPDEFKYATRSAIALNDLLVSVTYLSNSSDVTNFIAIMGSARETHP